MISFLLRIHLSSLRAVWKMDKLSAPNSSFEPQGGVEDGYYFRVSFTDSQNLVEMPSYYASWGFGGGFTYTNLSDKETAGFTNISSIVGTGKFGDVYLTANSGSFTTASIKNLQSDKYVFKGAWVTNTTYAYLAIKDGNDGNDVAYVKGPFAEGDWFKLTAVGYDAADTEIGRVDFYLADFRNGSTKIVDSWEWFDWSSLADADHISFELSSTDENEYGMVTPAYFCLDGITLIKK